jgi:hypothetical protein
MNTPSNNVAQQYSKEAKTKLCMVLSKWAIFKSILKIKEENSTNIFADAYTSNDAFINLANKAIQTIHEENSSPYELHSIDNLLTAFSIYKVTDSIWTATYNRIIEACLVHKKNYKVFEFFEELTSEEDRDYNPPKPDSEFFRIIAKCCNLTR